MRERYKDGTSFRVVRRREMERRLIEGETSKERIFEERISRVSAEKRRDLEKWGVIWKTGGNKRFREDE